MPASAPPGRLERAGQRVSGNAVEEGRPNAHRPRVLGADLEEVGRALSQAKLLAVAEVVSEHRDVFRDHELSALKRVTPTRRRTFKGTVGTLEEAPVVGHELMDPAVRVEIERSRGGPRVSHRLLRVRHRGLVNPPAPPKDPTERAQQDDRRTSHVASLAGRQRRVAGTPLAPTPDPTPINYLSRPSAFLHQRPHTFRTAR